MRLSIITACLPDRAQYLPQTADSVPTHLLGDTGRWDVQWILAIDGPGSLPTLHNRQPDIIIDGVERIGISATRNRALLAATGDWVLNLDADDTLDLDGLTRMADAITTRPDLGWAAGVLKENGHAYPTLSALSNHTWAPRELVDTWDPTSRMAFHPGVSWLRTDILTANGGWPALATMEDKLPVMLASETHVGITRPFATHHYRKHPGQQTASSMHRDTVAEARAYTIAVLAAHREQR